MLLKCSTETVSSRWFRWFSPVTQASSTTKTGRYDIAEILLKVVLNTKNPSESSGIFYKIVFSLHYDERRYADILS